MKVQADKKRTELVFQTGDWVYLKLQAYCQSSVQRRTSQKLSPLYYGPFLIIERLGTIAYRLALPAEARIHPIFHVSLLKRAPGPPTE